jgi:hypothetical protein
MVEASDKYRGLLLQPILQRVFRGAICAVQQGALLARVQEKITAERIAEAVAVLCSSQPLSPSICPLSGWWLYQVC